ncbi:MAG TPA: sulfotransferase [Rhodanobacteraceae bacterium]|jgi:tetratricopeptide (TPR) repeat protein|nr:sulfotransferase [Rhodanobacteraceae bacterium]
MVTAPSLPPQLLGALQKAQGELARRQFDAASSTLASVLATMPDCAPALGMAAVAAQMQGHHDRAVACFRKALGAQPNDAGFHAGLGISLFESGDVEGAIAMLRRACELAPGIASGWYNLGKALKLQVRTEEAIATLRRALRLDPSNVRARLTLADALASIGEIDAAVAELRGLLKAHPADAHAWFALANLKVVPLSVEDVETLRRNFMQASGPPEDRVLFGFALARALEDQADYAASFEVLRQANRLQRRRVRWDAAQHRALTAAIERAFSQALPESPEPQLGSEVVFIAGIPRSGSTLVEQILASHPEVEGANEITDLPTLLEAESRRRARAYPGWVQDATPDDWRRLGVGYLARTARWRERKPRFTDKNLATWKHVGAALAMLPSARVVIVRRDPVESCLACYRQWFASGTHFAYDLDEMADYCIDFARLTRFWLRRFPDRVFDLEYEALLADPEAMVRRLLDFCGLQFDPACLDFHRTQRTVISAASAAQVRQPLHRDARRAARYGELLDGLRQHLRDGGGAPR